MSKVDPRFRITFSVSEAEALLASLNNCIPQLSEPDFELLTLRAKLNKWRIRILGGAIKPKDYNPNAESRNNIIAKGPEANEDNELSIEEQLARADTELKAFASKL